MDFFSTIIRFFQEGGIFMYPIALTLAFGLAIALERYIYLTASRTINRRTFNQVMPMLKSRDYKAVLNLANKSKSAVSRVLSYGVARIPNAARREDVEYAMEEGLMEVIPRLEKRTSYVATFANISTLLGLLGTIIGLISAFTAVANADPAEKANLLSQSISVAMNTTAFGLIAAIPLLLIHTVLVNKTNEIVDSLEMATVKFLNTITEKKA